MFDSLEQQMKHNEDRVSTSRGRIMRIRPVCLGWRAGDRRIDLRGASDQLAGW
jgi:hypothetical protein